jgi:hypothetical protein
MAYPRVKVVVTGDNEASVVEAREVIDRALTAAGFPAHRSRHLRVISAPDDLTSGRQTGGRAGGGRRGRHR